MQYDSRAAILFSTSLTLAVLATALLSMRRGAGKNIPGLTHFAFANLLGMLAAALFGLRGAISMAESTVLGNATFLMSACLYIDAIRRFNGQPLPCFFFPTACLLSIAGMGIAFLPEDPAFAVTIAQASMCALSLFCGWILLYPGSGARPSFNRIFCSFGFYGVALISAWRAMAVQSDPSIIMFTQSAATTHLFIGLSLSEAIFGLGFIMMAHERIAQRLVHVATHDPLTGARTRGYFMDMARATVQGARDRRRHVSILIADLDHFKDVNDSLGHQAGDKALCSFVQAAQAALREGDFLARYGGEEFVALLPDTTFHEAIAIAERVRANTQAKIPFTGRPPVTVSIGVATTEQGCFDIDALIAAADQALYASKSNGRNRVTLATALGPCSPRVDEPSVA